MLRLRRSEHESRIEIMPLIDVIFLLLTFFIYAMVMMQVVRFLPMEMREFASATEGEPDPAVTVSIDQDGELFLDGQPITLEDLVPQLREIVDRDPATVVYIGAEERGRADRLPIFFDVYDRLSNEGLTLRLFSIPEDAGSGSAPETVPDSY